MKHTDLIILVIAVFMLSYCCFVRLKKSGSRTGTGTVKVKRSSNLIHGGRSDHLKLPKSTRPRIMHYPWVGGGAHLLPIIEHGEIIGVDVIHGGMGYSHAPHLLVTEPNNVHSHGAKLEAVVGGGTIVGVNVLSGGENYESPFIEVITGRHHGVPNTNLFDDFHDDGYNMFGGAEDESGDEDEDKSGDEDGDEDEDKSGDEDEDEDEDEDKSGKTKTKAKKNKAKAKTKKKRDKAVEAREIAQEREKTRLMKKIAKLQRHMLEIEKENQKMAKEASKYGLKPPPSLYSKKEKDRLNRAITSLKRIQ